MQTILQRLGILFSCLAWGLLPAQVNPPLPTFSADSILNSASGLPDSYSPYGLITIHGSNLALGTSSVNFENAGSLPVALASGSTRVLIRNRQAGLLYVAPDQIVALPPPDLPVGAGQIVVLVSSLASRPVTVQFRRASPALFLQAEGFAAMTRQETGENVTPETPAAPGDSIVLFATGLGPTRPNPIGFAILKQLAPLTTPIRVLLDGVETPADLVDYAGLQPGLAGTYQIRMRLPPGIGLNPEIRIGAEGILSPEGIRIPARPLVVESGAALRRRANGMRSNGR